MPVLSAARPIKSQLLTRLPPEPLNWIPLTSRKKGHVFNRDIARLVKSVKPQDEKGHGAILDGDREIVRVLVKRRYGNRRRAGREIARSR
jgi:hypothetical protein